MDITAIDRSATSGRSLLHDASADAKLAGVVLLIAGVIASFNALVLLGAALVLVAAAVATRLDLRLTLGLALYPALFAALFAFASASSVGMVAVIVLKAVTAALCAVVLILTTPYPAVFSRIQRILPGIAGDALLMTYRTFFLLAERFGNMLRAVRLRSMTTGRLGPLKSARAVGTALGNLVLYAVDLAERDYDVMRLRGYSGRLRVGPGRNRSVRADATVLLIAALVAATGIAWRLQWRALNPYSWLPTAIALAVLAVALIWRWARGSRA